MRVAHSSGSSRSSAPNFGTEQPYRFFRSSTTNEVRLPRRIKRIRLAAYLDVPDNWNRHCTEESEPLDVSVDLTLCGKYPVLASYPVKVFLPYPSSAFRGMPTHCPCP